jgi:hypothetical protein
MGSGIAIGVAMGVALGVAFDNLALGIAIGAAIGTALGAGMEQSSRADGPDSPALGSRTAMFILLGVLVLGIVAAIAVILLSR